MVHQADLKKTTKPTLEQCRDRPHRKTQMEMKTNVGYKKDTVSTLSSSCLHPETNTNSLSAQNQWSPSTL